MLQNQVVRLVAAMSVGALPFAFLSWDLKSQLGTKEKELKQHLSRLERNKKTCMDFYSTMFNENNPKEAIKLYSGLTYIQHNPDIEDGKQGFIKYFEKMNNLDKNKKVHFKKVFAEDNFVILHCFQEWPQYGQDYAGIDIFRLDDNGKIVEHWDVLQEIPQKSKSKNNNTMF